MPAKETVIFVHGAWHGKWCWDKYFRKAFEDQGYNVVTFNLPGHDQKGRRKEINFYSINDYVNALLEEVNNTNEPPIIIAHSMGGLILQKYLEKRTCKKAIFLASVPPYGVIKTTLNFMKHWYFYPSLLGLNLYGLVDSAEKSRLAFFSESLSNDEVEEYTSQLTSESFRAFLDMLLPRVKVTDKSNIPTLVVAAEYDTIFSINDNKKTATKFNAEFITISDIAHDVMLDTNHEKVSDAIITWLKK